MPVLDNVDALRTDLQIVTVRLINCDISLP
jgi:hypothetical protein